MAALLESSDPSTVVANIAAWLSEAVSHELSMGASMANIAATMSQWIGLGGVASALKGNELNFAGLAPMMAHCLKHVSIGQAAVEANTIARSSVIPAAVCQSNRDETAALYSTNWCGCNTPAIIALEDQYYNHFWPQNTSAGVAYATTLTTLMGAITSTPPPITPLGASPAAAAAPAESAAESAASNAGGLPSLPSGAAETAGSTASPVESVTQLLQPMQSAMTSLPQAAQSLAGGSTQFLQSGMQGFSSPLQQMMGMFPGLMSQSGASAAVEPVAAAAEPIAAGGGGAAGLGSGAAGGAGGVGYSGAGLTSFTRPASTFEPELGGRPTGLRASGFLNAAQVGGPTTTTATGGGMMPVSPAAAGMLGREGGESDKEKVTHARIVVDAERQGSP
ncbi:PPE domain-containing protein [Mycobacterium heckeshornense]|uniref:PPE domain-containing protein n=1 Tax=Mycobacterium heckeshornense TaxID=110505 RepID=UPI001364A560|nr:PPE domain-containing protein [Mycobacterium heckeshornense]MCV7034365.1 PPE domain-containing protein [Mycobacterium heckeshornense]